MLIRAYRAGGADKRGGVETSGAPAMWPGATAQVGRRSICARLLSARKGTTGWEDFNFKVDAGKRGDKGRPGTPRHPVERPRLRLNVSRKSVLLLIVAFCTTTKLQPILY